VLGHNELPQRITMCLGIKATDIPNQQVFRIHKEWKKRS
jgi:hypothetical protein